jgi:uncharacterized protein (DUF2164 family)
MENRRRKRSTGEGAHRVALKTGDLDRGIELRSFISGALGHYYCNREANGSKTTPEEAARFVKKCLHYLEREGEFYAAIDEICWAAVLEEEHET